MPRQLVGGGEKEALERLSPGREIANKSCVAGGLKKIACAHELSSFQFSSDIKHGFPFAHGEGLLVHLSIRKFPEDLGAGHGTIKIIFAGLQSALRMAARINLKRQRAAHHSIFFQEIRRIAARSAVWNVDKDAFRRETLIRMREAIPHPGRSAPGNQDQQKKQCNQNLQVILAKSTFHVCQAFSAARSCFSRYSFRITAAATASTVIFP